jgi:hypothetical protein
MHKPNKETMKRRATDGAARSARVQPVVLVVPVVMVEHVHSGEVVSFPKNEACPECGRRLLEG